MNTLTKRATGVAFAFAVLPFAASAVHAEGYRVSVGDLSQPAQADAFNRRVDAVAELMCAQDSHDLRSAAAKAECKQAIRDEVMEKLSPVQREQYAAYAGPYNALARTGQ